MDLVKGSLAFLFIVTIHTAAADSETELSPCCYPDNMSGEVYHGQSKMFTFYLDFTGQRVLEDWNGKAGTDFVFFDLANSKRYRSKVDGSCTVHTFTNKGNFAQCVPSNATVVSSQDESSNTVTYVYTTGRVRVVKELEQGSCLPVKITKSRFGRSLALEYRNVISPLGDMSIFNKDLSHCH